MQKRGKISKRKYALSKRTLRLISITCLLLLSILIFLDKNYIYPSLLSKAENKSQNTNSDFEIFHSHVFDVINIVDGDTLDINCPDNQKSYTRIRLLGVDTPEIYSESGEMFFAREASEFTKELVLGKQVTIFLDEISDTRDKFDRLLAYVFLPDGRFLNELLLSEGFAYSYTKYRHSYYNKYNQLESRAKSNKKGLWQNVKHEQFPQWLKESIEQDN